MQTKTLFFWISWLLLAFFSAASLARVYYSKIEALELAFGKDADVQMRPLFLTEDQKAAVERLARVRLESNLYTFYVGRRDDRIVGYAAIETHTVRTKPETLLVVLTPEGILERVEVLAFHEPPEYQPPGRWFAHLLDVPLENLYLGAGVEGISGATLSSRAALDSVRKVIALYSIVISGGMH